MKLLRINPAMKHEDNPSDGELFQSMLAGDEEALAALYRRPAGWHLSVCCADVWFSGACRGHHTGGFHGLD